MVNESLVGSGKVYLIAGRGKIYTDIAARFVRSERPVTEIIESPYSPEIVRNILNAGHKAALEFDYFLFGVEGFSRVCETQLVRKRHASYLIKSGRTELNGKRKFEVCLPEGIEDFSISVGADLANPYIDSDGKMCTWATVTLNVHEILDIIEEWYAKGVELHKPEEDLRYLKPQGTAFKGIIGMNVRALYDFFAVRCCRNAQTEIRDMATKMLKLCKNAAPDLFQNAGPNCAQLGYCPENNLQNVSCQGRIPTKNEALELIRKAYSHNYGGSGVISG